MLWAAPDRQAGLHPPVVSWGLDQGFTTEFDWPGTRDPSPALAAPEAIAFMTELGVDAVQAYDHRLAWWAGALLADSWGTEVAPQESQTGTMITIPTPPRCGTTPDDAARLRDALLFEDRIEVQVHARAGRVWVRVSAQIYNEEGDVVRLADAVARRS
jgi:isopenicillin-N epimerase